MALAPSKTDVRRAIRYVLNNSAYVTAWLAGGNDAGRAYTKQIIAANANVPVSEMGIVISIATIAPETEEVYEDCCQWYFCTFTVWVYSVGQADDLADNLLTACEEGIKDWGPICLVVAEGREVECRQWRVVNRGSDQPASGMWRLPLTMTCLTMYK